MIKIVADSTCDLSEELVKRYDITVFPLHVIMDAKDLLDGVEVTPEEIYAWSDEVKRTPKTSSPGIQEVVDFFKEMTKDGDELIVITIAIGMSTTNHVMHLAAEEAGLEDRISIVDSMSLSTGIGLQVITAAEKRDEGLSRAEIVSYLEGITPYVSASFVVDTLIYLYRGGRCNGLAALVGGVLKLHPQINVVNGTLEAGQKYRGKMSRVIMEYAEGMEERLLKARPEHVFVTYSTGVERETADAVIAYLKSLNHFKEIHETVAGGVISSHCGPGTLGVLFIEHP